MASWFSETNVQLDYTEILGIYIIGGMFSQTPKIEFYRTYFALHQHNMLSFSITVWIDSVWDLKNCFQIEFDSLTFPCFELSTYTNLDQIKNVSLVPVNIFGELPHTDKAVTLRISISNILSSKNLVFGFHNIELSFLTAEFQQQSTQICAKSQFLHMAQNLVCYSPSNKSQSCELHREQPNYHVKDIAANPLSTRLTMRSLESSFLNAPLQPGKFTMIFLAHTLQYIRYLNITKSEKLSLLTSSRGRSLLTLRFGFKLPSKLAELFRNRKLPEMFQGQTLATNFLANYWDELLSILVTVGAFVVTLLLEILCDKYRLPLPAKLFEITRIITGWNFAYILIATYLGDLIAFSFLEFKNYTTNRNSGPEKLSLIFCIFILIVTLAFFFQTILMGKRAYVSAHANRINPTKDTYHQFTIQSEGFRVIYAGLNLKQFIGRYFFTIYSLRLGLPVLCALLLYNHIILQTILQLLFNIIIVILIIYSDPIQEKISYIQLLIVEVLTLFINIVVLVLCISASTEHNSNTNNNTIILIGDIIVIANLCLNILIFILFGAKLIIGIRRICIMSKKHSKQEIFFALFRLTTLFLQQGGMGFEEVFKLGTFENGIRKPSTLDDSLENAHKVQTQLTLETQNRIFSTDQEVSSKINKESMNITEIFDSSRSSRPIFNKSQNTNNASYLPQSIDRELFTTYDSRQIKNSKISQSLPNNSKLRENMQYFKSKYIGRIEQIRGRPPPASIRPMDPETLEANIRGTKRQGSISNKTKSPIKE